MKKQTIIIGLAGLIIIIIIIAGFLILTNEKDKFIGTWQYSIGGTITFNIDDSVFVNNIGPLGLTELIGTITYKIDNNQVTFTSGSVSIMFNYNFVDSNTLILTNIAGDTFTLEKV